MNAFFLLQCLGAASIAWLVAPSLRSLPPSSHGLSCVSVCSLPMPVSYKDTSLLAGCLFRAHPDNQNNLPTSRSLTQLPHLPYTLIVTGPRDWEGTISGPFFSLPHCTRKGRGKIPSWLTKVVYVG